MPENVFSHSTNKFYSMHSRAKTAIYEDLNVEKLHTQPFFLFAVVLVPRC